MPDTTRSPSNTPLGEASANGPRAGSPGTLRKPPPNNLPLELSSFVGREREMAEVKGLLASNRLLTLTGSGGCGKTRLALAVARDLIKDFEEGVWLVELA
jgi:hypothetical protein